VSDKQENVSIKTFLQWRRDIKENGTVLCSSNTDGLGKGCPYHGIKATGKTERKKILFVLNNYLT
jgi:hypothetical protein